jgi:2-phospho-L-lactate guanylyltransferase
MRIVAVIPVKPAAECKQRLAPVLDSRTRRRLVQIMLDCVVSAASSAHGLSGLQILTNDRSLVPRGIGRIADPGGGVNAGLAAAAELLSGQAVDAILILPGDIPLVTGADIESLLELVMPGRLVVVPDASGSGTNALLLAPPTLVVPRFGAGSLAAHLRVAVESGAHTMVHSCPNIARDMDEPRDLAALLEQSRDPRFDFLRSVPLELCS